MGDSISISTTVVDYGQHININGGDNAAKVEVNRFDAISRQDGGELVAGGEVVNADQTPTRWERISAAVSRMKDSVSHAAISAGRGIANAPGAIKDAIRNAPGNIMSGLHAAKISVGNLGHSAMESLRSLREPLPDLNTGGSAATALLAELAKPEPSTRMIAHVVGECAKATNVRNDGGIDINLNLAGDVGAEMTDDMYTKLVDVCQDMIGSRHVSDKAKILAQHIVTCGSMLGMAAYEAGTQYEDKFLGTGDPATFMRENTTGSRYLGLQGGGDEAVQSFGAKMGKVFKDNFVPKMNALTAEYDAFLKTEPADKASAEHAEWKSQAMDMKDELTTKLSPRHATGEVAQLYADMAAIALNEACDLSSKNGFMANIMNDKLGEALAAMTEEILAGNGTFDQKKAALDSLYSGTVFLRAINPAIMKNDFMKAVPHGSPARDLALGPTKMAQRVVNGANNTSKVSTELSNLLQDVRANTAPKIEMLYRELGMPSDDEIMESVVENQDVLDLVGQAPAHRPNAGSISLNDVPDLPQNEPVQRQAQPQPQVPPHLAANLPPNPALQANQQAQDDLPPLPEPAPQGNVFDQHYDELYAAPVQDGLGINPDKHLTDAV